MTITQIRRCSCACNLKSFPHLLFGQQFTLLQKTISQTNAREPPLQCSNARIFFQSWCLIGQSSLWSIANIGSNRACGSPSGPQRQVRGPGSVVPREELYRKHGASDLQRPRLNCVAQMERHELAITSRESCQS